MYTLEQVREIADKACRYDNSRYQPWSDSNSPHYGDAEHFVRRVLDCLAERAAPAVAFRLETDGHITYWPESWQVERERKNLQILGYPAKVTPLYEHPSPPQAWKVAFDAQREAAMRAHTICYEVMLAHPEIAELGDDGRLHDAIHDILRVDLDAATLRQAPAQGGVTEAMVERAFDAMDAHFASEFPDRESISDDDKATAKRGLRVGLEAVFSAEPAAQGDAEALELLAAEYERWGSSGIAKALRANGVGNNAFDYEVAIRAVKRALAPPAQPAERVPEDDVRDAARYRFIRDVQATIIYKRKGHGVWEPLIDTRETSTRCASLDEAVDRAMLAASPAPSPARGDAECGFCGMPGKHKIDESCLTKSETFQLSAGEP